MSPSWWLGVLWWAHSFLLNNNSNLISNVREEAMKEKVKTAKTLQESILSSGLGFKTGHAFWWLPEHQYFLISLGLPDMTDFLIWVSKSQGPQHRQNWGETPSFYDERTQSSCCFKLISEHKYMSMLVWLNNLLTNKTPGINFKDLHNIWSLQEYMSLKKKRFLVHTRYYAAGTRNFPVPMRKSVLCPRYLVHTGDHPVYFSLLCFFVEMTVQELVELYFYLGPHY